MGAPAIEETASPFEHLRLAMDNPAVAPSQTLEEHAAQKAKNAARVREYSQAKRDLRVVACGPQEGAEWLTGYLCVSVESSRVCARGLVRFTLLARAGRGAGPPTATQTHQQRGRC